MDSPILTLLAEGRLIRGDWYGRTPDGRETACLYAALVPGAEDTDNCPSHLMPQWMADLTPWIDDYGTEDRWHGFVTRYAYAQMRWGKLTDAQWAGINRRFRSACAKLALAEAAKVCPADADWWLAVKAASEAITVELDAGREPTAAMRARAAAAEAAAEAAAWAAWAAQAAAQAAAEAAADDDPFGLPPITDEQRAAAEAAALAEIAARDAQGEAA